MILRWTLRKLLSAPASSLANVGAIALAFLLVLVFEAVWSGETEQMVAYADNVGADVWVMQEGVSNMHMATSFIPDTTLKRVGEVEGVAEHSAILYLNTLIGAGERHWFSYIVGVDDAGQLGGPWAISRGSHELAEGEAIVPEVLATMSGLDVGDEISIADTRFTIAGLSAGTFSVGNPITFVRSSDLADVLSLVGYDSYVLVRADPGVSAEVLAGRIREQVSDVAALPNTVFVENDRILAAQMGVELIGLMAAICGVLATLLIAFALYMHTARSRRDFAVLKALGFRDRHIYAGVVLQALALAGLASILAGILGATVTAVAPRLLPQLSMHLALGNIVEVTLVGLAVAVLATLIPVRQVAQVDPLSAFHA